MAYSGMAYSGLGCSVFCVGVGPSGHVDPPPPFFSFSGGGGGRGAVWSMGEALGRLGLAVWRRVGGGPWFSTGCYGHAQTIANQRAFVFGPAMALKQFRVLTFFPAQSFWLGCRRRFRLG